MSSTPGARAISLQLRAGEGFPDHQVHERAWVVVVDGEVGINGAGGERARPRRPSCGRVRTEGARHEQDVPTVWIEIPAIVASTASQRTSPNATRARGGPAYLAGDEVNDRLRVQFEAILVKRPLDLPEP